MKKFFTHNGTVQEGPFDAQELKSQQITRETMVWHEGLDKWVKAGDLPELKETFSNPPPFKVAIEPPSFPKETQRKAELLSKPKKEKSLASRVRNFILI